MIFRKQNTKYSCGPVAIYNAIIWDEKKEKISYLIKQCNTKKPHGTYWSDVSKVLRKYFPRRTKKIESPSKRLIDAHLNNGKSLIINYYWEHKKKTGRHYVFIWKRTSKQYYVTNVSRKKPVITRITSETMKKWLKHSAVWFIK